MSKIEFSRMVSISNIINNHTKFPVAVINGEHYLRLSNVYYYLGMNSGAIYYHLAFKRRNCILSFNRNHVSRKFQHLMFPNGHIGKVNFISARGLFYTIPRLSDGHVTYNKDRANDLRFVLYENYKPEINHSHANIPKINQALANASGVTSTNTVLRYKIAALNTKCEYLENENLNMKRKASNLDNNLDNLRQVVCNHIGRPWYKKLFGIE